MAAHCEKIESDADKVAAMTVHHSNSNITVSIVPEAHGARCDGVALLVAVAVVCLKKRAALA